MPRITIDFDERTGVAGEGASLPVADVAAAINGGAAPVGETEGLRAGATGDATEAGAPPGWLLEAIAHATAGTPSGASAPLAGEDGGAAPADGDGGR
jgi:hypothetical protein